MKKKMALIGSGISNSRMPRLQMHLGEIANIPVEYILVDSFGIASFDAERAILTCHAHGFCGVNITHPYKQAAWSMVSVHDHTNLQIGAYNTIKFERDKLHGANTDHTGFIRGYSSKFGDSRPGRTLIAGAGGVGRAIAFALIELGAEEICIFDASHYQARELKDAIEQYGGNARVVTFEQLRDAMAVADGIINCTPIGMFNNPGNVFPEAFIGGQKWAFDAVYTPLETAFLKSCRSRGIACLSGFYLWIYQGLDAFKIFTGVDIDADKKLLDDAMGWLN